LGLHAGQAVPLVSLCFPVSLAPLPLPVPLCAGDVSVTTGGLRDLLDQSTASEFPLPRSSSETLCNPTGELSRCRAAHTVLSCSYGTVLPIQHYLAHSGLSCRYSTVLPTQNCVSDTVLCCQYSIVLPTRWAVLQKLYYAADTADCTAFYGTVLYPEPYSLSMALSPFQFSAEEDGGEEDGAEQGTLCSHVFRVARSVLALAMSSPSRSVRVRSGLPLSLSLGVAGARFERSRSEAWKATERPSCACVSPLLQCQSGPRMILCYNCIQCQPGTMSSLAPHHRVCCAAVVALFTCTVCCSGGNIAGLPAGSDVTAQ